MNEHDGSLEPQIEPAPEWAIEPVGSPEEFGLTKDSRPSKKRVWDRQEVFLAAFARSGKPVVAARDCGISYWTHCHWEKNDVLGYRERLKAAHERYCQEVIEQDIDDTLTDKKFNHDILRIFRAKGEMPEKYRDNYAAPAQDNRQVNIYYNFHPSVQVPPEYQEVERNQDSGESKRLTNNERTG